MRRISYNGIELIKQFEGFKPIIYLDAAGHPTIGYGHLITEADKKKFLKGIDKNQALELLRQDVQKAENAVLHLISVPLTSGQFDALVSFTFNLGSDAFRRSTLSRMVNRQEHSKVPIEFMKWVRAGGKKQIGLVKRRAAEAALYQQ